MLANHIFPGKSFSDAKTVIVQELLKPYPHYSFYRL
jgi:hypothetical protein